MVHAPTIEVIALDAVRRDVTELAVTMSADHGPVAHDRSADAGADGHIAHGPFPDTCAPVGLGNGRRSDIGLEDGRDPESVPCPSEDVDTRPPLFRG